MSEDRGRLPGDTVELLTPLTFAVAFTRQMRRQRTAQHTPSLRTSLAIPKFLSARWARTRSLSAADYIRAAVLCTPLADQPLAEAVAHGLLFPEASEPKVKKVRDDVEIPVAPDDPFAALAGDLADFDLDALTDLSSIDDLLSLDEEEDEQGAFDLFEHLYSSANPDERALGELIHAFGGPAQLEANGLRTKSLVLVWVAGQLLSTVGELTPDLVQHGVAAGYGPDLLRACELPWELAGAMAGSADPGLESHLADILLSGTSRQLGRTLAFLGPHPAMAVRRQAFADAALARALDLNDFAELVVGLGEWIDAPEDLKDASMAVNPRRTLEAAAWLQSEFGIDLAPDLFDRWIVTQTRPYLGMLTVVCVNCPAWEEAVAGALVRELDRMQAEPDPDDTLKLAESLVQTELPNGVEAAQSLATAALELVTTPEVFLPLLDAFLERGATPDSPEKVVAAGKTLGVPEEEIWDRLGAALEQLRLMVLDDSHDADRFQRLVDRIASMPAAMMQELCNHAADANNFEALAALLAVDMGAAAELLPVELATQALGHRGIGGGRNLLVQWFRHRKSLNAQMRAVVKSSAMASLMDEAFHWMGAGGGSGEKGLLPQSRARPFRAGDGLDALDLEETLESIVCSGIQLDQVTEEDLFATDTAHGRAALAVLIDISGSMGSEELAACAIAVTMLLGRLLPEEVALAVFESNTHVVKDFLDGSDLDAVADQVLELESTGGTRVDAAFRWAAEQFETVPEADTRVLFLLSDFAFFEGEKALQAHGQQLNELGAVLLAATHGYIDKKVLELLLTTIGGERLDLRNLNALPALLIEALANLAG